MPTSARYPSRARRGRILFETGVMVKVLYSTAEKEAFAKELSKTADLIERGKGQTNYSKSLRRQATALRKHLTQKGKFKVTQSGHKMVCILVNNVEVTLPIKKKRKEMVVQA